jgi:hypothetical protein
MPSAADELVNVLFIAGLGRSGSTVIDRALGASPGCVSVGEVVRLWQRGGVENTQCGCGEPFRSCAFWGPVGDKAYGGWDQLDATQLLGLQRRVDRTRFIPWMVTGWNRRFQAQRAEYADYLVRLFRAMVDVAGADLVIDSSKDLSTTFLLQTIDGLDLSVVHLVRDSRAVAYSWTKQMAKGGSGGEMDRYSPVTIAVRYVFSNILLHGARLLGLRMRRWRYEDFVARPASTTAELLTFGGKSAADLDHIVGDQMTVGPHHSVGGNPMRFSRGAITIRLDDTWMERLASRDRRIVSIMTAPLLVAYGYPLRPRR